LLSTKSPISGGNILQEFIISNSEQRGAENFLFPTSSGDVREKCKREADSEKLWFEKTRDDGQTPK
jgi:hypothetical protein